MRAAVVREHGAEPALEDRDPPAPGEGQALVRVLAASLNPVDVAIASGRFYMDTPPPPYVPGAECVGTVLRSGRVLEGTPVWCLCMTGGMGEVAAVPEDAMAVIPDGVAPALASGLGVAGLAGWMPVLDRGGLLPGETVLVLAASGVVGQVAVQAAKCGGAGRIVAAARSENGRARALALGADAAVDLTADDVPAALREACPDGVDLIVDPVWGAPIAAALPLLRRRGRVVQVGSAAGQTAELPGGPLRGGRLDVRGYSVFSEDPEDIVAAYRRLAQAAAEGKVALEVEERPLEEAPSLWQRLRAGAEGRKLVLVP